MPSPVVPATPPADADWFLDDPALWELLHLFEDHETLQVALPRLRALGEVAPHELDGLARMADRHRPELVTRTPEGEPASVVEYHPSYRLLQEAARLHGVFTLPWHGLGGQRRASRALGFALGYLYAQAETGYYCPACMTDGAAFVLERHGPRELADRLVPRLVQRDPTGAYEGAMYLTEKGGGSDVGGGTATTAREAGDGTWRLTGEKWFASNCTADVALALARMPEADPDSGTRGLGLFVVPRHLDDGRHNPGLSIVRLKDKLGVTSMATGEVVLDGAHAELVEGPPDGFKAMAEMVNLSRLYNAVASVAVARRALREGQRVGRARASFGKPVAEHPLFLADLIALTSRVEGALAFVFDTADVFDRHARGDGEARTLLRVLTPAAKAVTARLAVEASSQACEFLGGNGYIEDYVTPRLLRDAQVLPIWEGTTNIQALELLRAASREGALGAYADHARAWLDRAPDVDGLEEPRRLVGSSLEALAEEAQRLAKADRREAEAASKRLLERVFHTHAAAVLCARVGTALDRERAVELARTYAAMQLDPDRDAGRRLIEALAERDQRSLAYPERLSL